VLSLDSLERKIKKIIKKLGVTVMEKEGLDVEGHYIAHINTIVIKASLSKWEKLKTLLHELGHASKHQNDYEMYNLSFSLHSKMEYEADCYLVKEILDNYMNAADLEPHQVNYMKFIESTEIDSKFEPLVKDLLSTYVYNTLYV
jgi:Zn-dependent peptidase ImmA (M78 family)